MAISHYRIFPALCFCIVCMFRLSLLLRILVLPLKSCIWRFWIPLFIVCDFRADVRIAELNLRCVNSDIAVSAHLPHVIVSEVFGSLRYTHRLISCLRPACCGAFVFALSLFPCVFNFASLWVFYSASVICGVVLRYFVSGNYPLPFIDRCTFHLCGIPVCHCFYLIRLMSLLRSQVLRLPPRGLFSESF